MNYYIFTVSCFAEVHVITINILLTRCPTCCEGDIAIMNKLVY